MTSKTLTLFYIMIATLGALIIAMCLLGAINLDNRNAHNINMCIASGGDPEIQYNKLQSCKPNTAQIETRLKASVWAVCNYTRTTDAPEEACGRAQDASNTEFMCEENSKDQDVACWVEVKHDRN